MNTVRWAGQCTAVVALWKCWCGWHATGNDRGWGRLLPEPQQRFCGRVWQHGQGLWVCFVACCFLWFRFLLWFCCFVLWFLVCFVRYFIDSPVCSAAIAPTALRQIARRRPRTCRHWCCG